MIPIKMKDQDKNFESYIEIAWHYFKEEEIISVEGECGQH